MHYATDEKYDVYKLSRQLAPPETGEFTLFPSPRLSFWWGCNGRWLRQLCWFFHTPPCFEGSWKWHPVDSPCTSTALERMHVQGNHFSAAGARGPPPTRHDGAQLDSIYQTPNPFIYPIRSLTLLPPNGCFTAPSLSPKKFTCTTAGGGGGAKNLIKNKESGIIKQILQFFFYWQTASIANSPSRPPII